MTIQARIEAVLIADDPSTFVTRRLEKADLVFGGIEGDRHFGITAKADVRQPMYPRGSEIMNRRQLSIVSVEELQGIAERLGVEEIKPEWLGANIVVSGVPELTKLQAGIRMLLPGGGGLVLEGENEPCTGPGKQIALHYGRKELTHQFVKMAQQSRGIVAYVERPGLLQQGDLVEIQV